MITVLLIRHADIDLPATSSDPPLNSAGQERATALVHVVRAAGIATLFTSPFLRTKQTVEPLALSLGIQPRLAPEPRALAEEVLSGAAGSVVLVAGHSNTVPPIIAALGASSTTITIGEQEFDNMFVVTTDHAAGASLLHLKYGTSSGLTRSVTRNAGMTRG